MIMTLCAGHTDTQQRTADDLERIGDDFVARLGTVVARPSSICRHPQESGRRQQLDLLFAPIPLLRPS